MAIMKTIENVEFKKQIAFEELFEGYFKDEFDRDFNSIVENYNTDNIKFDNAKINELQLLLKDNNWYHYFRTILEVDTWIDFEIEVENILKQLSILLKSETPQSKKVNYYRDIPINYFDFNLFGIIEHKLEDKELFSIIDKYVDKRALGIKSVHVLSDLSIAFENFTIIFNRYLVDVVGIFYNHKKNNQIIPLLLINEIYTFNYTPTLEKLYNIDKSKVVYLHGEMHEDSEKQNLVFGVNEITQDLKIAKAYDFTKYYQKIKKNSNKKFIEIPTNAKRGLDETIFYVMGHSLDQSDKEYVTDLFKFLEFDSDAYSKICIFYHSTHDREHKLKNLFNIIDKKVIIEMNKTGRLYFSELTINNVEEEFSKKLYFKADSYDIR
ncbi:Bacteriophage abortive infection AbiH [Flavobacterium gillisiae]|uniref:Bacteriophage abortive infection AbiH n=2 Tax=Flavobacterium gillisiae TaxID=150146 RepID=A0A1H4EB08_9FLAO|nr:Bacteriophage abortive infection AbiH [Flavobacterium gillisiae]